MLFRNLSGFNSARNYYQTERKTYKKTTTPKNIDMEKKFSKIKFTPIVKEDLDDLNTKYHERFKNFKKENPTKLKTSKSKKKIRRTRSGKNSHNSTKK